MILSAMDNLLNHRLFYLIFVDINDKISLVKPFENKELQKDIQRDGYRCISHVWGTYIADEDPDKHKFVWMDNLCIDQSKDEKRIKIMGDIYRKCTECVVMLDAIFDVPNFVSEREMVTHMAEEPLEFCRNMTLKHDTLILDDSDREVARKFIYFNNVHHAAWQQRVWTWQEAELPPKLLFCSEQAGTHKYDKIVDDLDINGINGTKRWAIPFINLMSWEGAGERDDIWRKVCSYSSSFKKCTNEEDFIYGILGIMDITIPDNLPLNKAVLEFRKELQKKGIFIGDKDVYDTNGNISSKGINLRKEKYTEYVVRNRYKTEKFIVLLEGDYYIGHEIYITKVGREKCTFKSKYMNLERREIFEIVENKVRFVGRAFRKHRLRRSTNIQP